MTAGMLQGIRQNPAYRPASHFPAPTVAPASLTAHGPLPLIIPELKLDILFNYLKNNNNCSRINYFSGGLRKSLS
jgi:hypothetical protein